MMYYVVNGYWDTKKIIYDEPLLRKSALTLPENTSCMNFLQLHYQ